MEKIRKENLTARNIIVGISFLLAFLFVINPPLRSALGINLVFLAIAFVVYSVKEYQDDLIGVSTLNILPSIGYGVLFTFFFYLITLVVPGMSIGLPVLPASISDSLKFFLVVFVAPIVESFFFLGALMAWISNFDTTPTKRKLWIAIIIQAVVFATFHLGAYISGFYMLPSFTAGYSAFTANLSAFIVAVIFGIVSGWFVTRDGIKNLIFAIVFHALLNWTAYSLSVVVF